MSVVHYTYLQLARLSLAEIERITQEEGLVGISGKENQINRILEWQAGKNRPSTAAFSAGMMTGPVLEAYALLLNFYDTKKETARNLQNLAPIAFDGILQRIQDLPALPTNPHSLRVAYLLMQDKLQIAPSDGIGPVAGAIRQLQDYFQQKDAIIEELLTLTDAALFGVVDQLGSTLVIAEPYVQINRVNYQNRTEVIYYLVVLQVR